GPGEDALLPRPAGPLSCPYRRLPGRRPRARAPSTVTTARGPMTDHDALPLARFKVLDLTRVRAGPTCVRQLADWGADVIKIETPPALEVGEGMGGARHGFDFQNLHRNKRSMTLNLK